MTVHLFPLEPMAVQRENIQAGIESAVKFLRIWHSVELRCSSTRENKYNAQASAVLCSKGAAWQLHDRAEARLND